MLDIRGLYIYLIVAGYPSMVSFYNALKECVPDGQTDGEWTILI